MDELERIISQLITSYEQKTPGSDEQRAIGIEIERLSRLYFEKLKVEEYMYRDQAEVDLNRERVEADIKRQERELNMKTDEFYGKKEKWIAKIKPDTVANCFTIMLLTWLAFRLEKAGYIIPRTLKFVDKLKFI